MPVHLQRFHKRKSDCKLSEECDPLCPNHSQLLLPTVNYSLMMIRYIYLMEQSMLDFTLIFMQVYNTIAILYYFQPVQSFCCITMLSVFSSALSAKIVSTTNFNISFSLMHMTSFPCPNIYVTCFHCPHFKLS